MSTYDQVIGDTLAQVNVVRTALGYPALTELPDARPGDTQDCLYYRALSDVGCRSVGGGSMEFASDRQARLVAELWGTEASGRTVYSPRGIRHVISAFDANRVSHYDV